MAIHLCYALRKDGKLTMNTDFSNNAKPAHPNGPTTKTQAPKCQIHRGREGRREVERIRVRLDASHILPRRRWRRPSCGTKIRRLSSGENTNVKSCGGLKLVANHAAAFPSAAAKLVAWQVMAGIQTRP